MSFKNAILTHDLKGSWWSDFAQKSTYYAIVRNSVLRRVENIIIHFIRQSISHEKIFLLMSLLSVAVPAQAQRYDFGQGVAAMACFMLESGYSRREVENVLDSLERFVIRDGISERGQEQMVRGYNYQTARLGCELRYRD